MSGTKPAKPWRVYGPGSFSTDHRSQRAAYERVNGVTRKLGSKAKVYHWDEGSWRLYEVVEAPASTEATAP